MIHLKKKKRQKKWSNRQKENEYFKYQFYSEYRSEFLNFIRIINQIKIIIKF
jgi:hypothetical protein